MWRRHPSLLLIYLFFHSNRMYEHFSSFWIELFAVQYAQHISRFNLNLFFSLVYFFSRFTNRPLFFHSLCAFTLSCIIICFIRFSAMNFFFFISFFFSRRKRICSISWTCIELLVNPFWWNVWWWFVSLKKRAKKNVLRSSTNCI